MANFEPKKLDLDDINGGIRFTELDGITTNAINDPIEAVAYSQTVVEHLTDTPDISEINGEGSPNVSFVSSTTADGVTIYKFKFTNLSGATFTPSLDEAGNLSWSNNRNLPNPPTINISGRDYLFSSEVLSGTYIPQVNSEVTDIPLTSFNRAPVDDIDHCYLFYYYTPENIYYWLATQVVDIQETTATLKILSVVRLTGYTPTIGENGNWFIGGEDTGKPSYGASGVTDVVAGASYNQDDFTITPLTFNFEVGNSKTVNVKAAVGNVEDGSYAKLAQVVRVDAAQSLTEAQKQQGQANLGLDEKYAKQDGTYPDLSAGKATADGSGNNISDTYAKLSQVVRKDTSVGPINPILDAGKNWLRNKQLLTSGKQITASGWYRIAEIPNYCKVKFNIFKQFNYDVGEATTITINSGLANRDYVLINVEKSTMGDSSDNYVKQVRFSNNVSNTSGYVDVYIEAAKQNSYWLSVDAEKVYNTDFEIYAFESVTEAVSDNTTIVDVPKNGGSNTNKPIYQQGSPVLVGSDSPKLSGTSGTVRLPSAGWYCINYNSTSLTQWYSTGVFYWNGDSTYLPVSAYLPISDLIAVKRAVNISSDGTVTVFDPGSGTNYTNFTVNCYKLA